MLGDLNHIWKTQLMLPVKIFNSIAVTGAGHSANAWTQAGSGLTFFLIIMKPKYLEDMVLIFFPSGTENQNLI